jgi:hypothetical protein
MTAAIAIVLLLLMLPGTIARGIAKADRRRKSERKWARLKRQPEWATRGTMERIVDWLDEHTAGW